MALLVKDGDYCADGAGSVRTAAGEDELLSEVLFRLTARRGGFPFLPELGSRMYLLRTEKAGQWEPLARQYAAEALEGLDGVTVTGVSAEDDGDGGAAVTVSLTYGGDDLSVLMGV